MSAKITPALTADEWRLLNFWLVGKMPGGKVRGMVVMDLPPDHQLGAMAVANACLPDDSPYKITRADVDLVRSSVDRAGYPETLIDLADKLAALLPPE